MSSFVVLGLITGTIYALFALGLVLMYQVTGVLNFALGAIGMIAAFCFAGLHEHMVALPAVLLVVVAATLAGAAVGRASLNLQDAPVVIKAAASIALIPGLQGLALVVWGTNPRATPILAGGNAFTVAGVTISTQQVLTVAIVAIAAAALVALFQIGTVGAAMRALASNVEVARLVGLPVRRLWTLAWAASLAAAAIAAVLAVPSTGLSQVSLTFIIIAPLVAALAAGFRRPGIAVASAMLLGLADGILQYRTSWSTYREVVPLAFALVALAISPAARARSRERV